MYVRDVDSLRLKTKALPMATPASVGQGCHLKPARHLGTSADVRSSSGTFRYPSLLAHKQRGGGFLSVFPIRRCLEGRGEGTHSNRPGQARSAHHFCEFTAVHEVTFYHAPSQMFQTRKRDTVCFTGHFCQA